jgi:hypothetical protein
MVYCNLRARAESYYGDPWAEDPACYLSDEELGITQAYEKLEPLPSKAGARVPSMPANTVEAADVAPAPRE